MKIIIVGGIAGGSTVSSQIRRMLPDAEITLYGNDPYFAYSTCGMPYVIGGLVGDPSKVEGPSPEHFAETHNISVNLHHDVLSIDRKEKCVEVRDIHTNAVHRETYDKLVLSPGGYARQMQLDSTDDIPLFTLKSIKQMKEILSFIEDEKPKSCAVIGGGFIGVELAENFVNRGIKTSLILDSGQVMNQWDEEMSEVLGNEMKENGVVFYPNDEVLQVDGHQLVMKSKNTIEADFIAVSIGLHLNTELAENAGLKIGPTKAIAVNSYMQTTDPDIYAIGDAAEGEDWFTGKPKNVKLSWTAHRQAYITACHLADKPVKMNGLLGTAITKLFSLTAAMTGHSVKSLENEKIPFKTVEVKTRSNSGYYPDSGHIYLRVHYNPENREILGAQAVGDKGIDKRIDVIATAIIGKLSIDDLSSLELCYAPAYSSPKDPVNLAGYKAGT